LAEDKAERNIYDDVERVLISTEELRAKVAELGRQITEDYRDKDLLIVGVLKGALMFLVDLARAIDLPLAVDFLAISSYGASTQSSGIVRIMKDLDTNIEGRHVLIVEDIVDSGMTLHYIFQTLASRNPASLRVCTLLNKQIPRPEPVHFDYVAFDVPDVFVIGYGLDYAEVYRNLPFIGVLKPSAIRS
jgi:hypoxanthine phosphoribosyltransferase